MLIHQLSTDLSPCRCLAAVVILAVFVGQASAQDDVTIIDLSDPSMLFQRNITASRVPKLGIMVSNMVSVRLPNQQKLDCDQATCVFDIKVPNTGPLILEVVRGGNIKDITILFDDRYKAGCRNYLFPVNATIANSSHTLAPVTLTCEPVPVMSVNFSGPAIQWRRFKNMSEMEEYFDNCTDGCSEQCISSGAFVVRANESLLIRNYSLTIRDPVNNHAWFVPTFISNDCTYVAPPTYLYRWPRIMSHYEFSLVAQEQTKNFSGLMCRADAFPPITEMEWTRAGVNMRLSTDNYSFADITFEGQLTVNGQVTISVVTFEDSTVFTCTANHTVNLPSVTNPSLNIRLRVKSRLRPLWPALGIIGVGIFVALFIIIGHFVDKAIERSQTEPRNPAHHKRLQSITSTMEENSSNNLYLGAGTGKNSSHGKSSGGHGGHHGAIKRVSSAKIQLLEESQA